MVSAGDPTAITAARPVLEALLATAAAAPVGEEVPATEAFGRIAGSVADSVTDQWLGRWTRVGWLSDGADVEDTVSLVVAAGNAGKIARRNVAAPDGWRALARRLGEGGIDYAVSGLVAARPDRATAAVNPVIYVEDPYSVVAGFGPEEVAAGRDVLLIAPGRDELTGVEVDGGIRFVSRAQGVLDAFAGSGREPDKAEDALRSLLAVCA